jgi:hypothetical protein
MFWHVPVVIERLNIQNDTITEKGKFPGSSVSGNAHFGMTGLDKHVAS